MSLTRACHHVGLNKEPDVDDTTAFINNKKAANNIPNDRDSEICETYNHKIGKDDFNNDGAPPLGVLS